MIKTEYDDNLEDYSQESPIKRWQLFSFIIGLLCIIGLIGWLSIRLAQKPKTLAPVSNNVSTLPLSTSTNGALQVTNGNSSTTNQSSTSSSSLGSSAYNLQNNSATGNSNQAIINNLQSTSTAQTGQSINPNLPY